MQLMHYFWDAAAALAPEAQALDAGRRFPLCQPEPLAQRFRDAGPDAVAGRAIDSPTHCRNFDDH